MFIPSLHPVRPNVGSGKTVVLWSPLYQGAAVTATGSTAPADGDKLEEVRDRLGRPLAMRQTSAAAQPTYRTEIKAGLRLIVFSDLDAMRAALGEIEVRTFFGVVNITTASGRPFLTRDTSQVGTTKPAFELLQET